MKFHKRKYNTVPISSSCFRGVDTDEFHIVARPAINAPVDKQAIDLLQAMDNFMEAESLGEDTLAFMRLFVSDYTNQEEVLRPVINQINIKYNGCAISMVQQAPLDGSKINLWAYFINGKTEAFTKEYKTDELVMQRNSYKHIWNTQLNQALNKTSSSRQTEMVFHDYDKQLRSLNCSVANNCIRTWLYVRDVDTNYSEVVKGRTKYFDKIGLTKDTHYIASTGINGAHSNINVSLLMDAYAVGGLKKDQVEYIQATDHLNPTHEYGVTFERATNVKYGDRNHIFISGTASIDNTGSIVHENEISGQIHRSFSNVKALLEQAEADFNDIAQLIVYLRDLSDIDITQELIELYVPKVPVVVVHAPVCRPGWLIEIECIAIKKVTNPEFHNF